MQTGSNMDSNEGFTLLDHRGKRMISGLACAVLLSLGFNGYQMIGLRDIQTQIGRVNNQVGRFPENLASVDQDYLNNLGGVKEEVEEIGAQAQMSAIGVSVAAQSEVRKNAEKVVKLVKAGEKRKRKMTEEIRKAKETARRTSANLSGVSTDVAVIRTEAAAAKAEVAVARSELSLTSSYLRRAAGDLGVTSGPTATNGKELQVLRGSREREYFEFLLPKGAKPQKIGDVLLVLKKSDPMKNQFTIEIVADDRKIEKRDKAANEPVQFYVGAKIGLPYELVVNTVSKESVSGYLVRQKIEFRAGR
jgi:hypothetical protein